MKTSPKHRWSISNNYLAGITTGDWLRLLRENRWKIDPTYYHRALVISLLSLFNSFHRKREEKKFREILGKTEITRPPLFILGHWRSGTTHLHNLLAQDTGNFAYANTYQVVNPHTFLTTEETNTRRFAWMIPEKRPMDNVALNFQSPQEDEFAPLLDSLLSPYLGITFPRHEAEYDRFLSFKTASPAERSTWKNSFGKFLKKLTHKYDKALLLKSPAHTARIAIILEMFPDAKFVHIHRDPQEVFQSFRHYYETTVWFTYLQRPETTDFDQQIFRRYQSLFDAFFEDLPLIPKKNFHEIAFTDLEADPTSTIRNIYQALNIPGTDQALEKIQTYNATLKNYRKNEFPPLTAGEKLTLQNAWSHHYSRWGYEIK
ncbi:sulfotransferase family protein [Luteolibacter sp. AS25]|uniref:sulfotransferase family protein n=1 Tax=Luteolibacter sp. AS25 TaxID=3135776 RepID=UPI00398A595F